MVAVSNPTAGAAPWMAPRLAPVPGRRLALAPARRLPASTYRRRRAVAAGLAAALMLVVHAAVGMLGGGPLPAPDRPSALEGGTIYVVQPGDTLWSIAQRLEPAGDPRPIVDRLVAAHGGTRLHVGERLPLPAS